MLPNHVDDGACEHSRTAMSALLDGEEPGVADVALARHLDGCAACREWRDQAEQAGVAATRQRTPGAALAAGRELTARVLAAITADPSATKRIQAAWANRWVLRVALGATALSQLLSTLPWLAIPVTASPSKLAWEAGALGAAVAVGFGYAALRPEAAKAMLPIAIVLGSLFLIAGVRELSGDLRATPYHMGHVVVLLQTGLLWALARTPQARALRAVSIRTRVYHFIVTSPSRVFRTTSRAFHKDANSS
ncbi:MAG: zf-HC2 domain-containing protein [Mycobacteriales bacterium]